MTQYQTFPGAEGASRTVDKLVALKLPDLADKRFLDVGCNEGFFCGFAKYSGASRVVGVDNTKLFLDRAKARFPDCEFLLQGWDGLPDGEFDVILLASALLSKLVDKLASDGVLIVELGIVSSSDSVWEEVDRGIDQRKFPSMRKLKEILSNYAWKWMGPSVMQEGDPVPRHVVHVSRRKPIAYLLMQPPGYGKTSIAANLFERAGILTVSGDELIRRLAHGQKDASPALMSLLATDFSPFRIDQSIRNIFDAGLGGELVALWQREAGDQSFALDVYVPEEQQSAVESLMVQAGYLPVALRWEPVGIRPQAPDVADRLARTYFLSLAAPEAGTPATARGRARREGPAGYVDDVTIVGDRATVRGWAVDKTGGPVHCLAVRLGQQVHAFPAFERQTRPDVQEHLGLPHMLYGYRVNLPVPNGISMKNLLKSMEVRVGESEDRLGPPLPFAEPLQRLK
jgi:SAM-dependent methyltransferase